MASAHRLLPFLLFSLLVVAGGERAMLTSGLLRPVDDAHAIDEAALLRYAAEHVAGFPSPARGLALTQFGHGQSNPTYCIEASAPGGVTARYVLRKKPPGAILQSAHAVEREFQVGVSFLCPPLLASICSVP